MCALLNGRWVAMPMEARSSRSVMIWNSSSAPRGVELDVAEFVEQQQVQAAVASHDAGQLPAVGGFGEFVDQLGGGGVADTAALLARGQPQSSQRMGFCRGRSRRPRAGGGRRRTTRPRRGMRA